MSGFLKMFMFALAFASISSATAPTIKATWAEHDVPLETNPYSPFWRGAIPVFMDANSRGKPDPRYRTEIRNHVGGGQHSKQPGERAKRLEP